MGKNSPTTFWPLGPKLGEEINERKISKGANTDKGYLTAKQANYVYRKVESGNLIKTDEAGDRLM